MRRFSSLFLVLAASLVLGACDLGAPADQALSTDAPRPDTSAVDTVTISFGASSFMRHVYQPLIDTFNSQHPGIAVRFVSLDQAYQGQGDYNDQMRQIVSRADTAESGANAEQFNLGLLRDLRPLMDGDPNFRRDDFYPSALSSVTLPSGAIYQLPQTLEVALLFYSPALLAARGVAAPAPDWSWADLEGAAQQLAHKQAGAVTLYGLADEQAYQAVLLNELKAAGLDLLATDPASLQLDRPEVAAALERVAGLFRSGAFYLLPQNADMRDSVAQLIGSQQVAMWGARYAGDVQLAQKRAGASAPAGEAIGAVPYPPMPGETWDRAYGYVMSSGTQHPNEAWAWLSFLSQQPIAEPGGGKGGLSDAANILPARKSLAEQAYWPRLDATTKAAMRAALDRPAPAPASAPTLDGYQPLLQAVQAIVGGTPAAQAASQAQATIADWVAQAQQSPTATPMPVVVATPAPQVAPAGATAITFGVPLVKGGDPLEQLAQQFNQSNSGVFVRLKDTFTGNGILSVPEAAAQTDCFASPHPPAARELTATLDLQPLIDADPSFKLDDYPTALLAPFSQGGQLRGLPWGISFRVLVYNQDLFDAAGLAPPSASWTTDNLLDAAQKLSSGTGETRQYGLVIPRATSEAAKFLIHLFGGVTTQGSGDTLRPTFTNPQVAQAARKVVDLLKNNTPHQRLDDSQQPGQPTDYGELTGQGRAAMWFAWGLYAYGTNQPPFTMAMAPPPLAAATLDADDISTSGLYISARTDRQQACWAWLKYFGGAPTAGPGSIPARRSVALSDASNQSMPGMAEAYGAYMRALDRAGQLAPGESDTPPIDYYWLYRAIDNALQGKDLERELAQAQALTEQYVACVRAGGARDACDQQADPSYGQR